MANSEVLTRLEKFKELGMGVKVLKKSLKKKSRGNNDRVPEWDPNPLLEGDWNKTSYHPSPRGVIG